VLAHGAKCAPLPGLRLSDTTGRSTPDFPILNPVESVTCKFFLLIAQRGTKDGSIY